MPQNTVSDLITDQEIAFALLILSGRMTDRAAAQAVGLNPDTAAYTKAKPCVRAYMDEHRAAVHQQLVEQGTEGLPRKNQWRQQVLDRLWEIANLPAEATRGSISGQVKAISMIVAIEGLIPDCRAGSLEKKPAPPPSEPDIYPAAWLADQQRKTIDPQPGPALVDEEAEPNLAEPEPAPGSAGEAPPPPGTTPNPIFDPSGSAFANPFGSSETTSSAPHAPVFASAPDTRVPFSIKKNPFARRR
jgi:hypothetical protein